MTLKLRTKVLFPPTVQGANGVTITKSNGIWTIAADYSSIVLDEDDMASNSASRAPSQQSVKAYVDQRGLVYDSVADVAAKNVPVIAQFIRTAGYYTAGDGGDALYKRVVSEPSHAGKLNSADGAWWEIAERVADAKMFGAKFDGATDDTTALSNFFTYLQDGRAGSMPAGTAKFTSALSLTGGNFRLSGVRGLTILLYAGADTTIDMITIGDGVSAYQNIHLANVTVRSTTTMTSGAAIRVKLAQHSTFTGIDFGVPAVAAKIWHGFWFDGVGDVRCSDSVIYQIKDAILVNGRTSPSYCNADLYLSNIYANAQANTQSAGIHVAGAFGGLYTSDLATVLCKNGVLIDTSIVATANREVFLGTNTILDASLGDGLKVDDALSSSGTISLTGAWLASNGGIGVNLVHWAGFVNLGSCVIFASAGDGIQVARADITVKIDAATVIRNNGGYGVNALVPTYAIYSAAAPDGNTSGRYSANARCELENTGVNGYWRDSNGRYHQYLHLSFTGAANTILTQAVTWPVAFPNQVFFDSICITPNGFANGAQQLTLCASGVNNSGANINLISSGTVTNAQAVVVRVSGR